MSRKNRKTQSSQPLVNIVMPVYGQANFLANCLESLQRFDAGVEYTVTLVDDESPEDMSAVYDQAEDLGCQIVYNRKNLGFAGTCNAGARRGRAPFVLLLNTDTEILHDGWLKMMIDEFSDPSVGVVGCTLVFFSADHRLWQPDLFGARPAGRTQHAGVAFDILGRPYHIFLGWSIDHPKVVQRREMNCVTGACLLTKRALWKRLGGLDEDYSRGNFEDVQYCILARLANQKVIYTPRTQLLHYAGGSDNSMTAKRNARLFSLKMGSYVEYDEWRYW